MSQYKNFKYGSAKYGVTSASLPRWGFVVDWDDDGFYDSKNEAEFMSRLIIERGREFFISSNNGGFEPISIGRATLTLDNSDGRYNPYNTASPLYPNIDIGKFAQIKVRYLTSTYTVFTGTIQDIRQNGYNESVTIILEDGLSWLVQDIAVTAIQRSIKAPEAIDTILAAVQWPWGMDLGNGSDLFYYWWADGDALGEIRRILDSELATYCLKSNGDFFYRSRNTAETSVLNLTQDKVTRDVSIPLPWNFRKNIVKVTGNSIVPAQSATIWALDADLQINAHETKTIIAEINDIFLEYTSYLHGAYSSPGGAGENRDADLSITFSDFTAKTVTITIVNNTANNDYLHELEITGCLAVTSSSSSTASGTGYSKRPHSLAIDLPWLQNPNAPVDISLQMLAFLNVSSPFPSVQIDNKPDIQFTPDLFDLVSVNLPTMGINSIFRLGHIRHEWTSENGMSTLTTWSFEPYRSTGSYWIFDTNAILGTSQLGW